MVRMVTVTLALLCFSFPIFAKEVVVSSPGGVLSVTVSDEGRWASYRVARLGEDVVAPSRLGLVFRKAGRFDRQMVISGDAQTSVDETWTQPWGESREIRNQYNQATVSFRDPERPTLGYDLVVRVYDDGLGFRYVVPEDPDHPARSVVDELTEFDFTDDGTAFWIPGRQWNRYEYLYHTTDLDEVGFAHTPITWKTENGLHISLHEAALVDYAGMSLKRIEARRFKADLAPWSDGDLVKTRGAFKSPWRTLQISDTAAGLVESALILNLNEPNVLGDVSWVEPGKYVGIWWDMHLGRKTWGSGEIHGATTDYTKTFIDFAATHGFDGVLVEGWNIGWDGVWYDNGEIFDFTKSYPDYDLEALGDYGLERGVRIIGHHETSGAVSHYESQMDEAFKLLAEHHVRQVKTGYVADGGELLRRDEDGNARYEWHDGQWNVNHHIRVLETAAKYKIAINSHEPVKDTGLRRTYPNWIAREGARGQEFNAWGDPPNSPEHTVILPFTRLLSGPMDFTPGTFDVTYETTPSVNPDGSLRPSRVPTTVAKQLALYVTIYSPIQMVSDLPAHYEARPDVFQFIKDVPTDWESTRVLTAEIGDHFTVARKDRASDDWYLGSITDEEGRVLTVDLDFLEVGRSYTAQIYRDGDTADWDTNPYPVKIETRTVSAGDEMTLKLAPGGGTAVRFVAN